MFVRDLRQGQKFRIINSTRFDCSNVYIYLGIRSNRLYAVLTNLWGKSDYFAMIDVTLDILDQECELITNTNFGQGKKYSELQAQWVSEYKVKPGNTVKIVGNAPPYPNIEGGNFSCDKLAELAGNLYTIRRVDVGRVVVQKDESGWECWVPYWSLEVQDETWGPMSYADRAELLGARIENDKQQFSFQITTVQKNGVRSGDFFITYNGLSSDYHWMDGPNAGKPVGKIGYLPRKV